MNSCKITKEDYKKVFQKTLDLINELSVQIENKNYYRQFIVTNNKNCWWHEIWGGSKNYPKMSKWLKYTGQFVDQYGKSWSIIDSGLKDVNITNKRCFPNYTRLPMKGNYGDNWKWQSYVEFILITYLTSGRYCSCRDFKRLHRCKHVLGVRQHEDFKNMIRMCVMARNLKLNCDIINCVSRFVI